MSLVVKKFVAEHNHVVSRVRPLIVHNTHGMYIIIDYIFFRNYSGDYPTKGSSQKVRNMRLKIC